MAANSHEADALVNKALKDDGALKQLIDDLQGSSRRNRQNSAAILSGVATKDASKLMPYGSCFVEALNVPEARTRWESLEVLTKLVSDIPDICEQAIEGAEASLFDEDSGPVRLSAMRFLCKLGTTSARCAERVWPLVDEGIQCYHGDLEFNDMLQSLVELSNAELPQAVKDSFKDRMAFDAEHGKGSTKHYAESIIANLS